MKQLILGGARSGKSSFAEQRARELSQGDKTQLVYVATATAGDSEMSDRIAQHQSRRDGQWVLVEEPVALADSLLRYQGERYCIVVDCLTLWLSNCLQRQCWPEQRQALVDCLPTLSASVLMVSNETGSGVVPMGKLSRDFVDQSGWLHQELASLCDQVTLVVAGLPLALK